MARYRRLSNDPPELRHGSARWPQSGGRFGYRRLWVLLRLEGFGVNPKRVYRLYREEGLSVRRRKRKRMAGVAQVNAEPPWSMDFVADALANQCLAPHPRLVKPMCIAA